MSITYQEFLGGTRVLLDGLRIGIIHETRGGYAYTPVGGKAGDVFPTVAAVKAYLEG